MKYWSLVFLFACAPPVVVDPGDEDDDHMQDDGVTVSCGTGTMLVNGVCELTPGPMQPDAVTCADGTTFDMGSNSCTPDITGCGPNTHAVDGVCRPVVRVSITNLALDPAPLAYWALDLTSFAQVLSGASGPLANAVLLGEADENPASTALREVALTPGQPYALLISDSTLPLALNNVEDIPFAVMPLPLQYSQPPGEEAENAIFVPVAGDQYLIVANLVYHVPVPSTPVPAGDVRVSFALFLGERSEPMSVGLQAAGGVEDPMAIEQIASNFSRTHEITFTPDLVVMLHGAASADDLGHALGSVGAPSGAPLEAGTRYVCVAGEPFLCFDGKAHEGVDSFKYVSPRSTGGTRKVFVNATGPGVFVGLRSASQSTSLPLFGSFDAHSGADTELVTNSRVDLTYGPPGALQSATFNVGNTPSFFLLTDDGGLSLDELPSPGLVALGTTTYDFVNAGTGPMVIDFPSASPDAATVAIQQSQRFFYITADCTGGPVTSLSINGSCYEINVCGLGSDGIVGEAAVGVYTPGQINLVDDDGNVYSISPGC